VGQPPRELSPVEQAIEAEDPVALVGAATPGEIRRLEMAERVLELKYNRKRRTSRLANVMSLVAFAGLGANAFQSYVNAKSQEKLREKDDQRWAMEFARAKQADKYRAFFETSALATDQANADKRLVGYALLQEFVDDKDYNDKATLMLEEALIAELNKTKSSEERRASVVAIVTALSSSSDCRALAKASRSIDRIAKRLAKSGDVAEAQEVFAVFVRRLVGRAAEVCKTPAEMGEVDRPLRDSLVVAPDLGGLKGKVTPALAMERVAQILRDECRSEMSVTGVTSCPAILRAYDHLCDVQDTPAAAKACAVIKAAQADIPATNASVSSSGAGDGDGGANGRDRQ
jgi:hypothetical protein